MKPNSSLSPLTRILIAAAFVSFAALAVLGDVHHLVAKSHRLPKSLAQRMKIDRHSRQLPKGLVKQMEALKQGAGILHLGRFYDIEKVNPKLNLTHNRADANINSKPVDQGASTIPLDDYYRSYLIANISLGTPPQNFSVMLWNSKDLEVLNTGARYSYHDSVKGHREFNGTVSSTFQPSDFNYTDAMGDVVGTEVSDTLSIGSLQVPNVQFGLLDTAEDYYDYLPVDGILGIDVSSVPNPDAETTVSIQTPLLTQLAASGQLSQPIITKWFNQIIPDADHYGLYGYGVSGNGELTIGADYSERCSLPDSYPTNITDYGWPGFNITSISVGSNTASAVNYQVFILDFFWPMFVDNATVQLIIEALGATSQQKTYSWCQNNNIPLYFVSDENLANGHNVRITAANGQVVTLQPRDLVIPYDGDNLLYVFDEAILNDCNDNDGGSDEPKWLFLGQTYLNNHCVSTNINTGVIGLGDVQEGSNN